MLEFEFEKLIQRVSDAVRSGTERELAELMKEFNTPVQTMVKTGWVTSNCSDIIFINYTPLSVVSGGNIQINNYPLQPGGYVGFMGNNAEINRDTYNVTFDVSATLLVVIKKLYTKK